MSARRAVAVVGAAVALSGWLAFELVARSAESETIIRAHYATPTSAPGYIRSTPTPSWRSRSRTATPTRTPRPRRTATPTRTPTPGRPTPTPTPTPQTAEQIAELREAKRQAELARQAEERFDQGAAAAAQGRLMLARSYFERVLALPLTGKGTDYRTYADQALAAIGSKGDEVLSRAQQLRVEQRYLEAADCYQQLLLEFRGTAIGQIATQELNKLLTTPDSAVSILVKRAQRYEQSGDLWRAYERYHEAAVRFPDTDLGRQAQVRTQELHLQLGLPEGISPEIVREARKLLMIGDIRSLNRQARLGLLPAEHYYQTVIANFPGTPYAEEAQLKLHALEGQP